MDQRKYARVHVLAKAIFYLRDKHNTKSEFSGTIEDISECGFKVTVNTRQNPDILSYSLDDNLFDFYLVDDYEIFNQHKNQVIKGTASIIRKAISSDTIEIGCALIHPDSHLLDYISDQKTIDFIANLNAASV